MDITFTLILGILNTLLLVVILVWLLLRQATHQSRDQLFKEEQTARHADIKTTLAQIKRI
jgi:hypothetical protein